ncbi:MAG: biotin--[acetyl-CoA-carboxylase] ligase [Ruminococcus sp.]
MNKKVNFIILESVDSTNSYAKELLKQKGFSPSVPTAVLSLEQTAGRGRMGREWLSKKGDSLTMSLILPCVNNPCVTLLAALGVHSALKTLLPCDKADSLRIKWPNDVVLEGKKLCGILTEGTDRGTVVGIGINLNLTAFPDEIAHKATSLKAVCGEDFDLSRASGLVADSVYDTVSFYGSTFTEEAKKAYTDLCINKGRYVYFDSPQRQGYVLGLSNSGNLLVQTERGTEEITSGEVVVSGIY